MIHALTVCDDSATVPAAPISFTIPIADMLEFSALAEKRRTEVQMALRLLEQVHARLGERSLQAACEAVAAVSQQQARSCSASTLRRKYEALAAGSWRSLVAGYKGPSAMPDSFVETVKRAAEDNHRSMAEAFELVRQHWRDGHPMPGYGTWFEFYAKTYPDRPLPKVCPQNFFPEGWSKRNLYRKAPGKGSRTLAQRGLAAAKRYFPSVKRDPSQLRPLELIVIDDFELDCLCVFPGSAEHKPQIGRVAGLLAMDVATRRKLHWGIGQRMERTEEAPDGTMRTVRTGISRVDVQLLIHGLFEKCGLPGYTVTIICENAAASISPELQLSMETLFSGRVKIERTGLINHKTLANGFCEKGGKPWEKGWIESAFNMLWNTLGAMPGYKGSNQRLNGPADLDAKINYTKLLLGQGEGKLNLPPEKIVLLRMPFPSPAMVEQAFAWACAQCDMRTSHNYIGFDRVNEFLLEKGAEPQPLMALALLPLERQQQVEIIERMESPIERWSRLAQGVSFTPIDRAALSLFLLTPKRVTFRNHAVSFRQDKSDYCYVDEGGTVLRGVADGTEYLAFFNPAAPEQLHLAGLTGDFVGTLTRFGGRRGMVDIRDKEALKQTAAVQATIFNRTLAEVRQRHSGQDLQLAADRAHNDAIVAGHKEETAALTTAQKIGLAAGEAAAAQIASKDTATALQKADGLDATKLF